ncbi:MAG: helix-turn-helix domain-containing protein [Spirochaetota bacterium]|nr:helix-turn-helix domain-containing protein [Spirochaetota bacterium]
MKYSTGFRNTVLKKVLPPENSPISEVSKETGVSEQTIRNWLFRLKNDNLDPQEGEVSPEQRSPSEKMSLIMEGRSLSSEAKGEWLRKNGIHSEHLVMWEQELRDQVNDKSNKDKETIRKQKKKIKTLEKNLDRKEKALAEMAALYTLKKKAEAIWGGDGED